MERDQYEKEQAGSSNYDQTRSYLMHPFIITITLLYLAPPPRHHFTLSTICDARLFPQSHLQMPSLMQDGVRAKSSGNRRAHMRLHLTTNSFLACAAIYRYGCQEQADRHSAVGQ